MTVCDDSGEAMRITFVSAALPDVPCGIGDYTRHLATAIAAAGCDVTVVTMARPGIVASPSFAVRELATDWRLRDTPRLVRSISSTRPDLVHVQFPGFGYGRGFAVTTLPWALMAAKPTRPVAFTLHEFDRLSSRQKLRVAAGVAPCRLIVVPGHDAGPTLPRLLRWRPWSRLAAIPLASNVIPDASSARVPADLRREPDELIVGYWGYIRPDKGLESLVQAFARLRATRHARLILAGDPGPDVDHRNQVLRWIDEAGVAEDTLFTGPLSAAQLSATLLGFDVCVLPFRGGLRSIAARTRSPAPMGSPSLPPASIAGAWIVASNTWFVGPSDPIELAPPSPTMLPAPTIALRPTSPMSGHRWQSGIWSSIAKYFTGERRRSVRPALGGGFADLPAWAVTSCRSSWPSRSATPNTSTRAYARGDIAGLPAGVRLVRISSPSLLWHLRVWLHLRRHPVRAYCSTSLIIPAMPGVPAIPVVLDLISFLHPEYHTRRTRWAERLLMRRAVTRHPVIAGSRPTRHDLGRLLAARRVTVVPPWCDVRPAPPREDRDDGTLERLGIARPFVVCLGTIEPRKNVTTALRAVVSLRQKGHDLRLVLVGGRGWIGEDLLDEIRGAEKSGAAVWPGYVSNADRDAILASACCLLMPSVYEGFGLPVLEAMQRGLPCICSKAPSFREVADDAVLRVETFDVPAWAVAVGSLLSDPELARDLSSRGFEAARRYSPGATAAAFLDALAMR